MNDKIETIVVFSILSALTIMLIVVVIAWVLQLVGVLPAC